MRNALFHPSIFRKMIGRIDPHAKNGDLVTVYYRDGLLFGTGLFSRNGVIGVRMVTFDATPFDEATLEIGSWCKSAAVCRFTEYTYLYVTKLISH